MNCMRIVVMSIVCLQLSLWASEPPAPRLIDANTSRIFTDATGTDDRMFDGLRDYERIKRRRENREGEEDEGKGDKFISDWLDEMKVQFMRVSTRNLINDSIFSLPFKFISRVYTISLIYLFRMTFGSNGLTWNNLAHLNNRIYNLCLPLTVANFISMDKKKRSQLISQQEEEQSEAQDPVWQKLQKELLEELTHTVDALKVASTCYDDDAEGIMAACVRALSPHDTKEINFYLQRAILYINTLMDLLSSFRSFEEAQQQHELTKRRLSLVCNTLEYIAQCIDPEGALSRTGRIAFSKVGGQTSSSGSSLLDLNPLG